jgi:DNA-binding Lrp family transcriptional regulator
MFDEISFKIILELGQDGRSSNAKLAQKLGISVSTVAKRTKAMLGEGLITIKAVPNPVKMGYQAGAFIGLGVDTKKIDSVCTRLTDNPHISLSASCFGRFDILLIVYFREWGMLQNFIKEKLPGIEGVKRIETYLISEASKRHRSIFTNNLTTDKPVPIDEVDQKLIEELIRNGRTKYADLADKLGMSASTISRRIAFFTKEDIIKIVAVPNPSKLGYSANAFVVLRADLAKIDEIHDRLSSYPEVHLALRLMNDYDVMFGVYSLNLKTLKEFLKSKVANIDGIINMETFVLGDFFHFSADAAFLPPTERPPG